jgi:cell division septation protein DedD
VNGQEIVARCVERGIALESSVTAVYGLFGNFLRSAVQRGQSIEVPEFGTFSVRLTGTTRTVKVPVFEPADALAGKTNEKLGHLKPLVIGSVTETPAAVEREYTGRPLPEDPRSERLGAQVALDTTREISADAAHVSARAQSPHHSQEVIPMPKLNLRDDGLESEPNPFDADKLSTAPPTLRDVGGGGGRSSPLLIIVIIIVALAAGVFLLNQFKVIHLWGKKPVKVTEAIPEVGTPESETTTTTTDQGTQPAENLSGAPPATGMEEPTPVPTPPVTQPTPELKSQPPATKTATPKPSLPVSSGGGKFTVQVSAWANKAKADEEASKLSTAGMDAFVESTNVGGTDWYRVRVGHYGNEKDAKDAASQLQRMMEGTVWVARAK